jgi:hypothetical protein
MRRAEQRFDPAFDAEQLMPEQIAHPTQHKQNRAADNHHEQRRGDGVKGAQLWRARGL